MNFESYLAYGLDVFLVVTAVTTVVCMTIWLTIEKNINKYNQRHPGHEAPTRFIAAAVRFAFLIIGLLIALSQVVPLQPMVDMVFSTGGVVAICCTFAARESFNNYIAGFLLSLHKPFKNGDRIRLNGQKITGTVKEITFRHTVVLTDNGTIMTIPNSMMNSTAIENLSQAE